MAFSHRTDDAFPYFPICSAILFCLFLKKILCIAIVTKVQKTTPVFVPYSCMDTSSKSWLPHQSQFGLVGQAEVCCGGPGVLTPSELRSASGGFLFFFISLSALPSQARLQSVVLRERRSVLSVCINVPPAAASQPL